MALMMGDRGLTLKTHPPPPRTFATNREEPEEGLQGPQGRQEEGVSGFDRGSIGELCLAHPLPSLYIVGREGSLIVPPAYSRHDYDRTDPFLKKEWYDIKAPGYFKTRKVGKTLITRTTGTSKLGQTKHRSLARSKGEGGPVDSMMARARTALD